MTVATVAPSTGDHPDRGCVSPVGVDRRCVAPKAQRYVGDGDGRLLAPAAVTVPRHLTGGV